MADFSHEFANSPIVPVMPFRGFPLQLQNWGMKQGQIILFFSWVSGIAHSVINDIFQISSVILAFECSHFDTCTVDRVKAVDKNSKKLPPKSSISTKS